MRPLLIVFALSVFAFENQDIPNKEQQIAGALQAVPENLREGATVYGYDSKGKVIILQNGSGSTVCLADNPHMSGFTSSAFHRGSLALARIWGRTGTDPTAKICQ